MASRIFVTIATKVSVTNVIIFANVSLLLIHSSNLTMMSPIDAVRSSTPASQSPSNAFNNFTASFIGAFIIFETILKIDDNPLNVFTSFCPLELSSPVSLSTNINFLDNSFNFSKKE